MDKEQHSFSDKFEELTQLVLAEDRQGLVQALESAHPAEIAQLIEATPPKQRFELWQQVGADKAGETLAELSESAQTQLFEEMSFEQLVTVTEDFAVDDLADIIPHLPEAALQTLLLSMNEKNKQHLQTVLPYEHDSAGGLMNTDIIAVRRNITVDTVLRYIRLLKQIPVDTDKIFVVDNQYHFVGAIYIAQILTADPAQKITTLIDDDAQAAISVDTDADDVANLFTNRNLISAPVVDSSGKLVGRITVDDVVDVIREEAESSVKGMVGVNDEDVFDTVKQAIFKRSLWLGINLITAFIAVFFIGIFSATLEQKVALAILMPIVASMGGIAGSQTLILVTRGLALGKVNQNYFGTLINKEVVLSMLNGVMWASVIAIVSYLWFGDLTVSVVIAIAVIFNLFIAAVTGVFLPVVLTRFEIDPALAGSVVLTTVTDVVGFVAFLGLASIFI